MYGSFLGWDVIVVVFVVGILSVFGRVMVGFVGYFNVGKLFIINVLVG